MTTVTTVPRARGSAVSLTGRGACASCLRVGVARSVVQNHYYVMHEKIGFRSTYSLRILQRSPSISHVGPAPHCVPQRTRLATVAGTAIAQHGDKGDGC